MSEPLMRRRGFASAGERLAGRELAKEARFGVEHYVPGQWHAVIYVGGEDYFTGEPQDIGRITYVDATGHLCVVLALREPQKSAEWRPTWVSRAGQAFDTEPRRIDSADEFPLTEKMLAALDAAEVQPWFEIDASWGDA